MTCSPRQNRRRPLISLSRNRPGCGCIALVSPRRRRRRCRRPLNQTTFSLPLFVLFIVVPSLLGSPGVEQRLSSSRESDERCDAMRCDAMRCDAMQKSKRDKQTSVTRTTKRVKKTKGGGVNSIFMHGRSRMTIKPRIPQNKTVKKKKKKKKPRFGRDIKDGCAIIRYKRPGLVMI